MKDIAGSRKKRSRPKKVKFVSSRLIHDPQALQIVRVNGSFFVERTQGLARKKQIDRLCKRFFLLKLIVIENITGGVRGIRTLDTPLQRILA